VDAKFIEKQGGVENAVEYINFLVSASNLVFEHEVDAHCKFSFASYFAKCASLHAQQTRAHIWCIIYPVVNIVHIEETGERVV
jgi:hypothetical protein